MSKKIQITIKELGYYKIEISGNSDVLDLIFNFMKVEEKIKFLKKSKIKNSKLKSLLYTTKVYSLIDFDRYSSKIISYRGYSFYILKFLWEIKKNKCNDLEITFEVDLKSNFNLLDKWKKILTRPRQLEFAEEILKLNSGIAQLPTGFGKTEIFLAIIESYLVKFKTGNILILVPKNSIKEGILDRLKKYSLEDEERIKVINPVPFFKLKDIDSYKTFLLNCEMVVIDEVHHAKASSYYKIYDLMPRVRYSYGFSATVSEQMNLTNSETFEDWEVDTKKCVALTGPCTVYQTGKDLKRTIHYMKVTGEMGKSGKDDEFVQRVTNQCENKKFKEVLTTAIKKYAFTGNHRIFFIPVPLIDAGRALHDHLESKGVSSIHWTGRDGMTTSKEVLESFEDLKKALTSKRYNVLIATSMSNEGVDLPSLSGVILAFGRDYKLSIQTSGRATRGDTPPLILNIFNTQDNMLKSQAYNREKSLKENYNFEEKIWNI